MILFLFILSCIYLPLSGLNWAATFFVWYEGGMKQTIRIHWARILLDMGMLAYFIWYFVR